MAPFSAAAEELAAGESESLGWLLLRTLLVLGIVVALIYLTLNWGLRRLGGLRGLSLGRTGLVSVLERIPLDHKRALFLVRAGGEYLLVGGGDQAVSLVSKLDAARVEAALPDRAGTPRPKPKDEPT